MGFKAVHKHARISARKVRPLADMVRGKFADGIGWGDCKQELFEYLNEHLKDAREEYARLIADPGYVEWVLKKGGERAREIAVPFMAKVRAAVGIRPLA